MNNRERIISAINHQSTDFIPYEIGFTEQAHERIGKYLGDMDFDKKLNNPISCVYYSGLVTEITKGSGYFKDDFGVVWNRNGADKDIGVVDNLIFNEPSMKGYNFPELNEEALRQEFEKMQRENESNFKIGSIGFSMFERAWSMRGMENLLIDMLTEPEFVEELLGAITEYNLKIIDLALEYNIDGFMFGDDWGQQSGLIMGPNLWRKFIKPRMETMYSRAKKEGKYILQHSCGDIREILQDLVEIGLDVYQTVQPEIYDLPQLKAAFGNKMTFWGGISTQKLLPFATPEEVKRVTRETLKIMGQSGGYIAAPTHAVPGDVPPENIMAMLEVFQKQ